MNELIKTFFCRQGGCLHAALRAHLLQSGIQQDRQDFGQQNVCHENRRRAPFRRIRRPAAGSGRPTTCRNITTFRQVCLVLSGNHIKSNSTYRSIFITFHIRLQRNNSDFYDGVFNVFTGADDISKVGTMDMWNSTKHSGWVGFQRVLCSIIIILFDLKLQLL